MFTSERNVITESTRMDLILMMMTLDKMLMRKTTKQYSKQDLQKLHRTILRKMQRKSFKKCWEVV